jgi:hypothetical protein
MATAISSARTVSHCSCMLCEDIQYIPPAVSLHPNAQCLMSWVYLELFRVLLQLNNDSCFAPRINHHIIVGPVWFCFDQVNKLKANVCKRG